MTPIQRLMHQSARGLSVIAALSVVACQAGPTATTPGGSAASSTPPAPTAIAEKVDIGGRSLFIGMRATSPTRWLAWCSSMPACISASNPPAEFATSRYGPDVDRYFADKGELDLEQLKADSATGPEAIQWTIHDEARAAVEHVPDIPLTYLRALQDADLPPEAQEIWEVGLEELLARSSNGRVVDVDGPHTLPPPPVHEAIDQMLELLGDP